MVELVVQVKLVKCNWNKGSRELLARLVLLEQLVEYWIVDNYTITKVSVTDIIVKGLIAK